MHSVQPMPLLPSKADRHSSDALQNHFPKEPQRAQRVPRSSSRRHGLVQRQHRIFQATESSSPSQLHVAEVNLQLNEVSPHFLTSSIAHDDHEDEAREAGEHLQGHGLAIEERGALKPQRITGHGAAESRLHLHHQHAVAIRGQEMEGDVMKTSSRQLVRVHEGAAEEDLRNSKFYFEAKDR